MYGFFFFFFVIWHLERKYGFEYNYYKDFLESNKRQIRELQYWQKGIRMKINSENPLEDFSLEVGLIIGLLQLSQIVSSFLKTMSCVIDFML